MEESVRKQKRWERTCARPERCKTGQDSLPAVKGRVTDASTGADIDFADVVIVDTSNRTVARTIVSGGEFRIDEVENGDFLLKIMLLGYRPYTSDTIAFRSGRPIDMGTVSLVPEENRLEEIGRAHV